MSERQAPYLAYSTDRLDQAAREAALRIVLTERNLQRALARQQQAEAATGRVRKLLARARGDLRLIDALLKERETFFEAEEGESEPGVTVPQLTTGRTLLSPCSAPIVARPAPAAPPVSVPEGLQSRGRPR